MNFKYKFSPINSITTFAWLAVLYLFSSMLLISCESHEQKADAFDRFKKAKSAEADTVIIVKEILVPAKKTKTIIINECQSEWLKYKNETEKKIKENEQSLKELRDKMNREGKNQKLQKMISRLEDENNEVHKKLNKFNDDMNKKLEKLKESLNDDTKNIGDAIKDLEVKK